MIVGCDRAMWLMVDEPTVHVVDGCPMLQNCHSIVRPGNRKVSTQSLTESFRERLDTVVLVADCDSSHVLERSGNLCSLFALKKANRHDKSDAFVVVRST
ncbi:hypothetical protein RQCS_58190 (plasmid) [Rhodococcus qingshengii]|nr:hypothetical protein RQCS_58190 [Rhodococcus qingshengii]